MRIVKLILFIFDIQISSLFAQLSFRNYSWSSKFDFTKVRLQLIVLGQMNTLTGELKKTSLERALQTTSPFSSLLLRNNFYDF